MEKCPICQESASDSHFNSKVPVCRACAAFFRRRVRSKVTVHCINLTNCVHEDITQCKYCRMEKCLEFGMKIENVQKYRDRHDNTKPNRRQKALQSTFTYPWCYQSSNFCTIDPHEDSRLRLLRNNFSQLLKSRAHCFPKKERRKNVNLLDALSIFRKDVVFIATWIQNTFPELNFLDHNQQRLLFRNFYLKFTIFETTYLALLLGKPKTWHLPTGDIVSDVSGYYTGPPFNPPKIGSEEVSKLFAPYWTTTHKIVRDPVIQANITIDEYILICALFLWDFGLPGQSDECIQLTNTIRQKLYRELITLCQGSTERITEIMLLLPAIQKSADLFEEELQMCGIYGILNSKNTDDWYEMVEGPI